MNVSIKHLQNELKSQWLGNPPTQKKRRVYFLKLYFRKTPTPQFWVPSWELTLIFLPKRHFWVVDFPFPKVGYVSFLEVNLGGWPFPPMCRCLRHQWPFEASIYQPRLTDADSKFQVEIPGRIHPPCAWYTLPETNIPPETLGCFKMSFSLGRPPTRCHVKVLGSVWGKSCFEMKMKGIWNYGIEIPRTNVRNMILWKLSSAKSKRIPYTPSSGVSLWTPSKIICLSGNP